MFQVTQSLVYSAVAVAAIGSLNTLSYSANMLVDAVRWNILNVIRLEFFFNCYKIWNIFINSSLQSPRGQYALVTLLISLLAHFAIQFNFSWLLSIYIIYLAVGIGVWLGKRVYFYHRRLDSMGVNQTIHTFDLSRASNYSNGGHSTGTLKASGGSGDKHANNGSSSASSASSSAASSTTNSENTNSLQRQRASAYRDFQSILNEPRNSPRAYAVSLAHLSNVSKLVAHKDVFDEMHFQILATRRDVTNIILRVVLLSASLFLVYFS